MKNKLIIAILLMTGTSAMAQTSVSQQTQITQTRDFVASLLNQMASSTQEDRFTGSSDYAKAGPKLQKEIEAKLSQFKDSMNALATGSLGRSVDEYNKLVRDQSLSDSEKTTRLDLQFRSLQMQVRAASAAYKAALGNLYSLELGWMFERMKFVQNIWDYNDSGNKFVFRDGSVSQKVPMNSQIAQSGVPSTSIIQDQISKTLARICKTKFCESSIMGDYTYFFSSIATQLDHSLDFDLADGKHLNLEGTEGQYRMLTEAISTYSFENDQYRKLLDRN